MTNALTTAATLAVMLLHALFGCCWHHDHASCAASEVTTERVSECPCGHDHGDGRDAPVPSDETPIGGQEDCCGEVCAFMSAGEVTLPSLAPSHAGLVADDSSAAVALHAARLAVANGPPPGESPSMRRLPILCVWRL